MLKLERSEHLTSNDVVSSVTRIRHCKILLDSEKVLAQILSFFIKKYVNVKETILRGK